MQRHVACAMCYSDQSVQSGSKNYCPECDITWCHTCNMEQPKGRWFFGAIDHYCWCRSGTTGPLVCEFLHFCRFTTGKDGRRRYRSDYEYNALSIGLGLLWFVWVPPYWLAMIFVWSGRATFNIFKKASWFTYILAPIVFVLLIPLFTLPMVVWLYWVICVQTFVVACLSCTFRKIPLSRDPAFVEQQAEIAWGRRRGWVMHQKCQDCYGDSMT